MPENDVGPVGGVASRSRKAALAGHAGDEGAARRALDDDEPVVRATALGALARMGLLRADDLAARLEAEDPRVRRRAAELCGRAAKNLGHPVLDDCLIRGLSQPDVSVAEACAWALGERSPAAPVTVPALCQTAESHPDALCREAAVAALGAIGDPAGLASILKATQDKAAVRRRAVIALAPFDGPEVEAALERALTDRDWQVRQAAEDLT